MLKKAFIWGATCLLLLCVAPTQSWAAPEFKQLVGRWWSDSAFVTSSEAVIGRICGTDEYFSNGTSQSVGEIKIFMPETEERFGYKAVFAVSETYKEELIDDRLVSTKTGGSVVEGSAEYFESGKKINPEELDVATKAKYDSAKAKIGVMIKSIFDRRPRTIESKLILLNELYLVTESVDEDGEKMIDTYSRTEKNKSQCP